MNFNDVVIGGIFATDNIKYDKYLSRCTTYMITDGMKWVTREKAKVDRIACPWLIKKFIDSKPEFLFVPADKVLEVAKKQNAIPFDIPNIELGHHGDKCSFDAIIEKYNLNDPALLELAKIVRAADTNKKEFAAEVEAIAEGFRQITKDDFDNMSKQFYVYDALYAYCKRMINQKSGGS
jgi:hypothetical protein